MNMPLYLMKQDNQDLKLLSSTGNKRKELVVVKL